ncbi:unnamed protein product [Pleuronectes platessa]|uniref:Uncharacterized protein n=1 Tax=Pleuronectes platessa TaxID=8262 RepID=A0A9N7VUD1_PLEPL|nr:unnamed protein product [Pleuronectes platessa]
MEEEFAKHLKQLADQFHGLAAVKCRELASEYAEKNNIPVPANWTEKQCAEAILHSASPDWQADVTSVTRGGTSYSMKDCPCFSVENGDPSIEEEATAVRTPASISPPASIFPASGEL